LLTASLTAGATRGLVPHAGRLLGATQEVERTPQAPIGAWWGSRPHQRSDRSPGRRCAAAPRRTVGGPRAPTWGGRAPPPPRP